MPDEQPAPEKTDRKSAGPVVAVVAVLFLFVLPAIYALSLGPVVACRNRIPQALQPVLVIYAPLAVLYDRCPPVRPAMDWYMKLWLGK